LRESIDCSGRGGNIGKLVDWGTQLIASDYGSEKVTDMSAGDARPMQRGLARNHWFFLALIAFTAAIFWKSTTALVQYSLNNESASHILLIPAISLYLVFLYRGRIFQSVIPAEGVRFFMPIAGIAVFAAIGRTLIQDRSGDPPSLAILFLVVLWIASFYFSYGGQASRSAMFPLGFLILAVPLPTPILDRVIGWLQEGSTTITDGLFHVVGVPVFRQGFLLTVPGVTIEVARECSGIRSSVALLITCLLAAHMYLKTWWKMVLFVSLVLPWSILKNGIRIATLTLLSVYVNPDFLRGNLHRDGGVLFFLLALAGLLPVLILLHRSEAENRSSKIGRQHIPATSKSPA
jgi:exosortase